jgi:hypothetical protein
MLQALRTSRFGTELYYPKTPGQRKKKEDLALCSERRIRFEFLSITQQFARNVTFRNYTDILFEM